MTVILKPGKEKPIKNRHSWIFSGAVQQLPDFSDGDILPVMSSSKELLGHAYFNRKAKIIGRMLSFGDTEPLAALKRNIESALKLRNLLIDLSETNCCRIINGEGDLVPGLIVDKYAGILSIQISTLGMEKLKPDILEILIELLKPKAILEKSILPSRKEEGLSDFKGWLYGEAKEVVRVLENNLNYDVHLLEGQKTGFFLDHREMRRLIRHLAKSKRVLNCFSYTGGFSVPAAAGGALQVDSVDISDKAIELAKVNCSLNKHEGCNFGFYSEDVFQFLRNRPIDYDIVILDPPAFAKKQKDVVAACRGYKDINRIAMQKMPKGSLLLSSSCSYYVDEALFQTVLFQAAKEADRSVKIVGKHQLAADHPINLFHPESDYLKSFLLFIE